MAYSTEDEIKKDFKKEDWAATNSLIKSAQVTEFITEADALIDSYIGASYVVPVATGAGLNLLKLLSRSLVAARIKRILEVVQETNQDANQNILGVLLSPSQVMKILENLRDKKTTLEGAIPLAGGGGFANGNAANCVQPVVRKDETQW